MVKLSRNVKNMIIRFRHIFLSALFIIFLYFHRRRDKLTKNKSINQKPQIVESKSSTDDFEFLHISNQSIADLYLPEQTHFYDSQLAIIIISSRTSFKIRNLIRKTWAKGHKNVFFIVGDSYCDVPNAFRDNNVDCKPAANFSFVRKDELNDYVNEQELLTNKLRMEKNVVLVPGLTDTYANLTKKVKEGIKWVMTRGNPEWLMKIDEDSMARIARLENYLESLKTQQTKENDLFYIGSMISNSKVVRNPSSKWYEWLYKIREWEKAHYPTYANGCCGYILSNKLVRYIADNADVLVDYHNEDSAVGIWLDQSKFRNRIKYIDDAENWLVEQNPGKICDHVNFEQFLVFGHHLKYKDIKRCYSRM